MGHDVSPLEVAVNGTRHLHAIERYLRHPPSGVVIESFDVPLGRFPCEILSSHTRAHTQVHGEILPRPAEFPTPSTDDQQSLCPGVFLLVLPGSSHQLLLNNGLVAAAQPDLTEG